MRTDQLADSDDSKFYRLLESAPDAIVITGADGLISLANAQAERLFGYSRDELTGQRVEMLIPDGYRKAHTSHLDGYFKDPHPRSMGPGLELFGRRKDGTDFPVEISLSPLDTESGTFTISSIRDISARRRAEAERDRLLQERAAHAEANRIKDEFLATLSHELRTPLNAIVGWTSLLLREPGLDGRTRHALETVLRNAHAQTQLIEDLIDLSRVIAGKLRIDAQPIDVAETVYAAVDVVRPTAEAKSIAIEVHAEATPLLTVGDADRLRQAVWNLLANAVKFTGAGGCVTVRLSRAERSVRLVVTDTGIGIAPEFLPHVFDRFRQGDSSTTRAHGGLGLGLAIVRSIVDAHGGTAVAASDGEGAGATFTIELPAPPLTDTRTTAQRPGPKAAQPPGDRLEALRVLVVDDAPDERALFAVVLSGEGATVHTAGSAAEALDVAAAFGPDVIVSDIAMPDVDGYALLAGLRASADARLRTVPAIAVTAHARHADRQRALAAGFQLYVSKPVHPDDLVRAVRATGAHVPQRNAD